MAACVPVLNLARTNKKRKFVAVNDHDDDTPQSQHKIQRVENDDEDCLTYEAIHESVGHYEPNPNADAASLDDHDHEPNPIALYYLEETNDKPPVLDESQFADIEEMMRNIDETQGLLYDSDLMEFNDVFHDGVLESSKLDDDMVNLIILDDDSDNEDDSPQHHDDVLDSGKVDDNLIILDDSDDKSLQYRPEDVLESSQFDPNVSNYLIVLDDDDDGSVQLQHQLVTTQTQPLGLSSDQSTNEESSASSEERTYDADSHTTLGAADDSKLMDHINFEELDTGSLDDEFDLIKFDGDDDVLNNIQLEDELWK
ncbi:hypothetical protein M0R45_010975 [Rubus argutus]|uniref:Zinc finger protein n=1 Tax=Rubus argutus TaxID=59490 RepID=A0AAW1YAA4_RUBAR